MAQTSHDPQRIQLVTMVKMRPGAGGTDRSDTGGFGTGAFENVRAALAAIGGEVTGAWNVFGNDYDVLLFTQSDDPKALHRIDAAFKALGYEAKTHPMVDAEEYAELARQTMETLRPALRVANDK
jgi:uncharacterized protein with GYD domain